MITQARRYRDRVIPGVQARVPADGARADATWPYGMTAFIGASPGVPAGCT
jgi:hypothetical protein